jgi:hypothetical protein
MKFSAARVLGTRKSERGGYYSAREWLFTPKPYHYYTPQHLHLSLFNMPSTSGYLSFSAVVALIVALVLAFAPHQSDSTYCYDTVTTLSDQVSQSNCFTVSSSGIFSRVFTNGGDVSSQRKGHVIPGLIDGHGHLLQFGELLQSVNIFGSSSLIDAVQRVEEYLKKNPELGSKTEWIRGTGWDQAAFGRMPTAVS